MITVTYVLPPPPRTIKRITEVYINKRQRTKHKLKRFVLSRVCKSCKIGCRHHGILCQTLLTTPYPDLIKGLVADYRELPRNSGNIWRPKRYVKEPDA